MINLDAEYIRAYLRDVAHRIERAATVLDWAHGQQTLISDEIIPPFPADSRARERAEADWDRYKAQIQGLGPRILKSKRNGAIGEVNWGGDNVQLDERLEALDLRELARKAFDNLVANGISAAWAYIDEDTNEPRIQVLGGYLEPIYAEGDPDGQPIGLFQAMQDPAHRQVRYRVRIYDFHERSIREWRGLQQAAFLAREPDRLWEQTSQPRVVVFDTNQDGRPVGELDQALELLKGEVATQLRILRVADAQAFSLLYMIGVWDKPFELGATTILRGHSDQGGAADAGRIEAGDMQALFTLHDRVMERLRADLMLPIASIGEGGWPSGEALQQANIAYVSSSTDYANLMSTLLTDVVRDYSVLAGRREAPEVSVTINREQMRQVISMQVREDWRAGMIPLRAAVLRLAPYYPEWASEEIEAFLAREEGREASPPAPPPGALEDEDES